MQYIIYNNWKWGLEGTIRKTLQELQVSRVTAKIGKSSQPVKNNLMDGCVEHYFWNLVTVWWHGCSCSQQLPAVNRCINLTWTQQRDDGCAIKMIQFVKGPKHQVLKTPKCRETRRSQVVIPSINRAAQMSSFVPKRQFPISSISCAQCKPQRARAFVSTDLMLHWGPRKSWWLWGRAL